MPDSSPLWSLSLAELQQMAENQERRIVVLETQLELMKSNLEGLRLMAAERSEPAKRSTHYGDF